MRAAVVIALVFVLSGCGANSTRLYVPVPDGGVTYRPTGGFLISPDGANQWSISRWLSYGGATARATAEQAVNDCTPSCVDGHHSSATVTVVFSGRAPCEGENAYAEMTVTQTSKPSVTPVGSGLDLTAFCGYPAFRPGLPCLVRNQRAATLTQQKRCFDAAVRARERNIARARRTVIQELLLAPPGQGLVAFQRSEAAWQKYRQTSCAVVASAFAGGTVEPVIREACIFDRDNAHLLDLSARYPG